MPKRAGIVTKDILVDAPLPKATDTYTVIGHGFVIDKTLEELKTRGFTVNEEVYKCNQDAQVAQAIYRLNFGDDPELAMLFAFANSYDKSMRFKCAVGAYVRTNEASMISSGMSSWARKHTGTSDEETARTITQQLENAGSYFDQLVKDKEAMKGVTVDKKTFSSQMGRLYFDKLLTGEQMGIIVREYDKDVTENLWDLYNYVIMALSKSHPRTWMDQQKLVHLHLLTEFDIAQFDEEPEQQVEDPATPPAAGPKVIVNTVATSPEATSEQPAEPIPEAEKPAEEPQPEPEQASEPVQAASKPTQVGATLPGYSSEEEAQRREPEAKPQETTPEAPKAGPQDKIFISKVDVESLYPGAKVDTTVYINDIAYNIDEELTVGNIDGYNLSLEVEGETPGDESGLLEASGLKGLDETQPEAEPEAKSTLDKLKDLKEKTEATPSTDPIIEEPVQEMTEDPLDNLGSGSPPAAEPGSSEAVEEPTPTEPEPDKQPEPESVAESAPTEAPQDVAGPATPGTPEAVSAGSGELDPIGKVIAKELEELYGSIPEHKYELKDGQYNVQLSTGEVVVLLQEYIDGLVKELT